MSKKNLKNNSIYNLLFKKIYHYIPEEESSQIFNDLLSSVNNFDEEGAENIKLDIKFTNILNDIAFHLFKTGNIKDASILYNHVLELKYNEFISNPSNRYLKRINIELTSLCNLKCKYCNFKSGVRENYIDLKVLKKTIEESCLFSPNLPTLALYMSGESLLHPQFLEILEIVAEIKKETPSFAKIVYLHTNGMLWAPEMHDKIMKTGALTRVVWSIDGVNRETFERMRKGANYDTVLNNFEYFLTHCNDDVESWINNLRDDECIEKDMDERLLNLFLRADNTIISQPKNLNSSGITTNEYHGDALGLCSYLFDTAIITVDGKMSLCCVDYNSENSFSDLKTQTFEDVYCGSERINILKQLYMKKRETLPGCKNCNLLECGWNDSASNSYLLKGMILQIVKNKFLELYNKQGYKRVALFGAGKHTLWLEEKFHDFDIPKITAVIDDIERENNIVFGLKPILSKEFNCKTVDAIILSSDCYQKQMKKRCRELYGKEIPIIDLYEGLPPGPYNK